MFGNCLSLRKRFQTPTQILSGVKPDVPGTRLMELLASSFSIYFFSICHDLKMNVFFISRKKSYFMQLGLCTGDTDATRKPKSY